MSTETVTTIDLLRHGEPEGGARYRGSRDDPLSARGWEQMRAAVGDRRPWQQIISSPLVRCADFARELAARHAIPLEIMPNLQEMSFGAWEGRTAAEIMVDTPRALELFWRDPLNNPPPQGESLLACDRRVATAWKTLLSKHAGHHVLVVAHGGIIRLVLRQVLQIPLQCLYRLEVPYATLSQVRVHGYGTEAHPLLAFHANARQ